VYKLDPSGSETILHSFSNGSDGAFPSAGLAIDGSGGLFGVTYGGADGSSVFRIDADGTFHVLAQFFGNPSGDLVLDGNHVLYGTTRFGGAVNAGSVYAVSPAGTATVLYSFADKSIGFFPYAGLLRDKAGNLYGTTYSGYGNCDGTLFKLDAKTHALKTLHSCGECRLQLRLNSAMLPECWRKNTQTLWTPSCLWPVQWSRSVALGTAVGMMLYDITSSRRMQMLDPTREKTDAELKSFIDSQIADLDANNVLYAFDASRDYDPPGKPMRSRPLSCGSILLMMQ